MKNRILSVLMALVFVFAFAVKASATSEMPSLQGKGSLSLVMNYDGKPLENGKVNILQVGAVEENAEGDYDFRIFAPLGRQTITQQELYSSDVAKELLTKAKVTHAQSIVCVPITSGSAVFKDLAAGLYVVWQEDGNASSGLSPFQPFLISVPRLQNGQYSMDVTATPKVPLLPEPTEPSNPPTEPDPPTPSLPQTGQLNWPIPVMAIAGVLLIMIGLILCVNRKRNGYEK